jgi:hypothetical protein
MLKIKQKVEKEIEMKTLTFYGVDEYPRRIIILAIGSVQNLRNSSVEINGNGKKIEDFSKPFDILIASAERPIPVPTVFGIGYPLTSFGLGQAVFVLDGVLNAQDLSYTVSLRNEKMPPRRFSLPPEWL